MKKKRKLKRWVLVAIGFMLGIIYSNLFIYSDLITKAETNENELDIQIPNQSENVQETQKNEEITDVFEDDTCNLDEVSCEIKKAADNYGVDWKLAVAISKHETGNYTSYAFKSLNNVGGMMYWNGTSSILKSFNSLDEGINAYVSNLKTNYYDMGLTTIEEIQKKYAPIGATNDPNDLNSYWVKGVYNYYNLLDK